MGSIQSTTRNAQIRRCQAKHVGRYDSEGNSTSSEKSGDESDQQIKQTPMGHLLQTDCADTSDSESELSFVTADNSSVGRRSRTTSTSSDHTHDVFVAYSNCNRKWVENELREVLEDTLGLKCLFGNRDFIPGKSVVESIVSAIESSRRTLVVLSRDGIIFELS